MVEETYRLRLIDVENYMEHNVFLAWAGLRLGNEVGGLFGQCSDNVLHCPYVNALSRRCTLLGYAGTVHASRRCSGACWIHQLLRATESCGKCYGGAQLIALKT